MHADLVYCCKPLVTVSHHVIENLGTTKQMSNTTTDLSERTMPAKAVIMGKTSANAATRGRFIPTLRFMFSFGAIGQDAWAEKEELYTRAIVTLRSKVHRTRWFLNVINLAHSFRVFKVAAMKCFVLLLLQACRIRAAAASSLNQRPTSLPVFGCLQLHALAPFFFRLGPIPNTRL